MSDLISRSALEKIVRQSGEDAGLHYSDWQKFLRWIRKAPAVDAVPVVRCKECKNFMPYTEKYRNGCGFDGDCAILVGFADCERECVHGMDFCSKGVRKGGESNE